MMAHAMHASLVLGAAGFAFYVVAVATMLRLSRRNSPALVAIGAALFAYAAVLLTAIGANRPINFWVLSAIFSFPTMVFLMAFGALYKSVSLRILADLFARAGQAEPRSAILQRYIASESFETRLALILENKWAISTSAGYALTKSGQRVARLVAALQRVFAIQRSG
jgi:hypothetical protein